MNDIGIPDLAKFSPSTNKITVDVGAMRAYPFWRRQVIAIWIHELVHLYQWNIVCRRNVDKWNSGRNWQEAQADKAQDAALRLMGIETSVNRIISFSL